MIPIHADAFWHDGRGPELVRLHWDRTGRVLICADYYNPDDAHGVPSLRRLQFVRAQVVMITPEEVINYLELGPLPATHRPAAMFDLGRSPWLESFSPRHLALCHHYRVMFYDELLDVIAEGVIVGLAESMPLARANLHLHGAGNVEAPAWAVLVERGYQVQAGPRGLTATGPTGTFESDGALSLLGLVAIAEARGEQWEARDDEVDGYLRATGLEPLERPKE